ncbi:hypothetical protein TNCV_3181031 [Trichonephila clavipes]|nr:hypothetical protein TNCV_3181031 [Trichonephila clavipes]
MSLIKDISEEPTSHEKSAVAAQNSDMPEPCEDIHYAVGKFQQKYQLGMVCILSNENIFCPDVAVLQRALRPVGVGSGAIDLENAAFIPQSPAAFG